ncbi:hypothetical protein BS47DRAFT_1371848 [Hydnum rufescens UP504]|uniref:GPI-anchored wall transfer protein n=1 Tax=Hydnum rufescens UP504 TaxID=1448309 RepID=A0A9P6DYT4_9AGAM|nr:hypothetical protein BS47DRAFT_1371848 [Hydnum rufescens UP504]
MSSYKASKEAFVSDAVGSTVLHVNSVSCVALASIFLHSAIQSRFVLFPSPTSLSVASLSLLQLWVEFCLLVLPLLLSMTLFANYPIHLCIMLLAPTALLLTTRSAPPPRDPLLPPPTPPPVRSRSSSPTPIPGRSPEGPFALVTSISTPVDLGNGEPADLPIVSLMTGSVPYITTYRSHMMLMTILAILAVDFPVFPRSLMKCESFGVSLMDLGVGSFVFSQGLVSAIPVLKNPRSLEAPLLPKIAQVCRKVIPLFALGLVRVVLEHVTEYGVHWNFFITMAILPPLFVLLHPMILKMPISLLGMIITICKFTFDPDWALGNSREGLISQNKEGIVSVPGYLAIHVLGFLTGTLLLPPSPSMFRRYYREDGSTARPRNHAKRQPAKAAIELISYSSVWWILFSLMSFWGGGSGSPVSRRLANLPYVLWIAAFNTSDAICVPRTRDREYGGHPSCWKPLISMGLPLFLLANAMTGLVNLASSTMYASDVVAMSVLLGYSEVVCMVAWACRGTRIVANMKMEGRALVGYYRAIFNSKSWF